MRIADRGSRNVKAAIPISQSAFRISKSQFCGFGLHRIKHKLNMLVQRNSELGGGVRNLIAIDRRCECLVFPFFLHRLQLDVGQEFGGPH